jgi:hypothetical protein
MISVYLEQGCLWENLLESQAQYEVGQFHFSWIEKANIVSGGGGEEVDMSCALAYGIYAMKLGSKDGEPHQSLDSKVDYK